MNNCNKRIILASASPRRRELLSQIGMEFEVRPSGAREETEGTRPSEIVEELSALKARDVFDFLSQEEKEDALVIGADTIVSLDGKIMGKPEDSGKAALMLGCLQGRTHQVYSGVTLIFLIQEKEGEEPHRRELSFHEKTDVSMFPMSEREIESYVATGEPLDKAGAYGIQGKCAAYIRGIEGDYYNVVGLPLGRLCQEMKKAGLLAAGINVRTDIYYDKADRIGH